MVLAVAITESFEVLTEVWGPSLGWFQSVVVRRTKKTKSSSTVQYLNEALQVKRSAVQGWWSVYDDVH